MPVFRPAGDRRWRSHPQLGENDKGFMLDGRDIDVQATGVRARGGFRYLQPQGTIRGWAFWRGSAPMMAARHGATSRKT
jgi:uncharacterized protein YhdP